MNEKTGGQENGKLAPESGNGLVLKNIIRRWKDMTQVSWQIPLLIFIIYFTYFYLQKGFWIFLFSSSHLVFPVGYLEPVQGAVYKLNCRWK